MESAWKELTKPTIEALSLAQAKTHLSIGHDDDNLNITEAIRAAHKLAEEFTTRYFGPRSFRLTMTNWPCDDGYIRFPIEPVQSVTAVKYTDQSSVVQTVDAANYRLWLDASPPLLRFVSGFGYPTIDLNEIAGLQVEFVAGETEIPPTLAEAIKLTLGYWYQFPGGEPTGGSASRGLPGGAISLLDTLWTGAQ